MVACKIIEKKKYNEYILKVGSKEISLVLEFHGVNVATGDSIVLDEKLIDKKSIDYVEPYAFEMYGFASKTTKLPNADFAILSTKDGDKMLRRVYG